MTDKDNTMGKAELEKILKSHREWLLGITGGERAELRNYDLTGADLTGADLRYADLRNVDLRNVDLRNIDLRNSYLINSDLRNVNLKNSDLRNVDLRNSDLRGANLDFASWPLWCGSLKVKVDSRIAKQLMYHALAVLPGEDREEFLADPLKYANGFHRVISWDVEKIT